MLGEESHKAALDSSAGDNRIVCAVIYTVWHWEVSSTWSSLGSWANGGRLPHRNKIPTAPPWRWQVPITSAPSDGRQLKAAQSAHRKVLGILLIHRECRKGDVPWWFWSMKMHGWSFLAFLLHPLPDLGFVQSKLKGVFHPCNLQLQPRLEGHQESHYPHLPSPRLGDNSSKGERSLKSTWASFWIPALPWG